MSRPAIAVVTKEDDQCDLKPCRVNHGLEIVLKVDELGVEAVDVADLSDIFGSWTSRHSRKSKWMYICMYICIYCCIKYMGRCVKEG